MNDGRKVRWTEGKEGRITTSGPAPRVDGEPYDNGPQRHVINATCVSLQAAEPDNPVPARKGLFLLVEGEPPPGAPHCRMSFAGAAQAEPLAQVGATFWMGSMYLSKQDVQKAHFSAHLCPPELNSAWTTRRSGCTTRSHTSTMKGNT